MYACVAGGYGPFIAPNLMVISGENGDANDPNAHLQTMWKR